MHFIAIAFHFKRNVRFRIFTVRAFLSSYIEERLEFKVCFLSFRNIDLEFDSSEFNILHDLTRVLVVHLLERFEHRFLDFNTVTGHTALERKLHLLHIVSKASEKVRG